MTDYIDMRPVDAELLRVVVTVCGLVADFFTPPVAGKPYIVITPMSTGDDETALLLDSYREVMYTFDYVGEGREQVRGLQTKVHELLIVGRAWSTGIGICGVTVSSAGAMRRDDETTFVLPETIRVKVSNI